MIELGLQAASSVTDAAIHKKLFGSGVTTLIISNEELNGIIKIVKSVEASGLLIKDVSETFKIKSKRTKKREFLEMLLGTLGASLLGSLLKVKGTIRSGE